jgi:small-conductance mechanosensitive channel/CRP-like cAMP-binding protein
VAGALISRIVLDIHPRRRLAAQAILFAMLSVVLYLSGIVPYESAASDLPAVQRVFTSLAKLVWWMSLAWMLAASIRVFLLLERQPRDVRLVQDLVVGAVYVGAVVSAIASVFSVPVGTLVATSGVFAVILGLALQSTLGDVFSGVALRIGGSYSVGDWIVLNDGIEGRVVETNWRATRLLNGSNDVVVIPNSALAKVSLTNFSSHDRSHGVRLTLRFVPNQAPRSTVEVMHTLLLSSKTILRSPAPTVEIKALTASSVEIELSCRVADMSGASAARSELFDLAYRHACANGLLLAPGGSEAVLPHVQPAIRAELPSLELLEALPLFKSLTRAELEALAETMVARSYGPDEIVVEQGAVLRTLAIIRRGTALVTRRDGEREVELTRLAPGDSFGERGLLTGAGELGRIRSLTRLTVIEIAEAGLKSLMHDRPRLAEELASTLAKQSSAEKDLLASSKTEIDTRSIARLGAEIRRLFGLQDVH